MCPDESLTLSQWSASAAAVRAGAAPALTILWHQDITRIGAMYSFADLNEGEPLHLSRRSPAFSSYTDTPGPLDDPFLSRQPCLSLIQSATGLKLVPATSDVSVALDGKTLRAEALLSAADLAQGRILTLGRRVVLCLHSAFPPRNGLPVENLGLLGHSDAIQAVRSAVLSAADLDRSVLIRGDTGTGKELTAAGIVRTSRRRNQPFVAINIAALPSSTAVAELFGHEKGAFTGATESRKGYFGEAEGGTLFLDEIGLATADVQAALLRAIETGEVSPLGSRRARPVDVRVLAATDAHLEERVDAGSFSLPLLHRLSSIQIRLPSLRERRQDIGVLFLHFLRSILEETGELAKLTMPVTTKRPWLAADVLTKVALASWPGNVRQLRNFATQLAVINRGADTVCLDAGLLSVLAQEPPAPLLGTPEARQRPSTPAQISHEQLLDALERSNFQPAGAARALGISRTTIYELIRRDPQLRKAADIDEQELRMHCDACHGDLAQVAMRLQVSLRALQMRLSKRG